jgi:uncharacterized protein (TIGR03435 family)
MASMFEVASIKRNASGPRAGSGSSVRPGGLFNATNVPLDRLIRIAYDVLGFQLIGAPERVREDRFDIAAKSNADATRDQTLVMLQALLKDRFRLALRMEKREMPAYALVLARSDSRLGPTLLRVPDDCDTPAGRKAAAEHRAAWRPSVPRGGTTTNGQCQGMVAFARNLSSLVEMPVIDKTGLHGRFDYAFAYDPSPGATGTAIDPNLPSLFTALSDQLGLKLDRGRESVQVLVIESVQPPAEN